MSDVYVKQQIPKLRAELKGSGPKSFEKQALLYFDLACFLGCSTNSTELIESYDLFQSLIASNYKKEECFYQLSIIALKLGRYKEAKSFADSLVQLNPTNVTFLSLQSLIIDRISHDAITGMITGISFLGIVLYFTSKSSFIRLLLHRLRKSLS